MKRPPQNNFLNLVMPKYQNIEPALKKTKLAFSAPLHSHIRLTPAEQQNEIIVTHLNNALMCLDNAQKAIEQSNNELKLRTSQMQKEIPQAEYFVSFQHRYQLNIDLLFTQIQRLRNYLIPYLENTKQRIADSTFSLAVNNPTPTRITQLIPDLLPQLIDVKNADELIIENSETPVEALEVYTAVVAPQKQKKSLIHY